MAVPSTRIEQLLETQAETQKQLLLAMQGLCLKFDTMSGKSDPLDSAVKKLAQAPMTSCEIKLVHIKVQVARICDVNTKEQQFSTRLHVDLMWLMPPGESPPEEADDDGDWMPDWTPKLRVRGAKSEDKKEMYTTETANGKVYVLGQLELMCVISSRFELHQFPNDCQDLIITIQSQSPSTQCKFISPMGGDPAVEVRDSGMFLDDFKTLPGYPFTYNLFQTSSQNRIFSAVEIKVKLVRRATYYIINVAFIMFLICTFVLCAWAVHPGAIGDRWGVDFALLLTAVAFKLILSDMLPRLSYLTTLDIYVLAGFIFLAAATFSHTLLPVLFHSKLNYSALTLPPVSVEDEELVIDADLISFYVFAFGWLAWNLAYGFYFHWSRSKELRDFRATAKAVIDNMSDADDELMVDGKRVDDKDGSVRGAQPPSVPSDEGRVEL